MKDTIIDFAAAAKHGVKTEGKQRRGECQGARRRDPARQGLSFGRNQDLARRRTRGKIVLSGYSL
jgi:hypothetical protein